MRVGPPGHGGGGSRRGWRARSWRHQISASWAALAAVRSCCGGRGALCLLVKPVWGLLLASGRRKRLSGAGSEIELGTTALGWELHPTAMVFLCSWVPGVEGCSLCVAVWQEWRIHPLLEEPGGP